MINPPVQFVVSCGPPDGPLIQTLPLLTESVAVSAGPRPQRCAVDGSPPGPSHGGDPHHHLAAGGCAEPWVVGPQLAQDVQDGVATVLVQNSPEPSAPVARPHARPARPPATAQAVGGVATAAPAPGLAAGAERIAQVLGLLVVQDLPLLIDSLPSLEDPVHGRALVDYEAWWENHVGGGEGGRDRGRGGEGGGERESEGEGER